MLRSGNSVHILPYSSGRNYPAHGYTVSSLCKARFYTNTSSLAITVGFLLPTLTSINQKLEKHVNQGDDITMNELIDIFSESSKSNLITYGDRLVRVALETALACVLIETKNEYLGSVVYVWDLYPRLHQYYVSELFKLLHIPRFIATLLGPAPSSKDIAFVVSNVSPVGAFEDAMKRKAISWSANVTVDLIRIFISKQIKDKKTASLTQVLIHTSTTFCCSLGAGVGRFLGGDRGEYWGELAGLVCVPLINVAYVAKLLRWQLQGRSTFAPTSVGHRHHHRRSSLSRSSNYEKASATE